MPLRETYGIDVDDASFNEFMRTFEKYQDALGKLPSAWGKVNEKIGATKSEFADIAASLMAMVELMSRAGRASEGFERAAGGASRYLSSMAREAHGIAHHLGDATRSILRWTGITSAATGLLGFGSVWGLEHIGAWAGNLRRTSMGLGFAPGSAATMQAFQTNLGRLVDPGQFLGGVNQAMHDATMRWALYSGGVGENQIRGGDTGTVGLQLLQNIWRGIRGVPQGQLAQVMQARGWDQFLSMQDAVRLRQTPYSEIQNLIQQTRYDAAGNAVKITDQDLRRWQDFQTALQRAGNTLWDTIVRDLEPLATPLKNLSLGFTQAVDAFLQAPWLKQYINEAADGLQNFAKYVGTDQFKNDVASFITNLGILAKEVEKTVKYIASWIDPGESPSWDDRKALWAFWSNPDRRSLVQSVPGHAGYQPHPPPSNAPEPFNIWKPWTWFNHTDIPGRTSSAAPGTSPPIAQAMLASGLPPEAAAFMMDISSGEARDFQQLAGHGPGSANAYPDRPGYAGFPKWPGVVGITGRLSHGAGMWQDEPGTWKSIAEGAGLTNFRDPEQQIQGNWWWAQHGYASHTGGRDLLTDLRNHTLDPRGRAWLGGQWARGGIAGGARYRADLAMLAQAAASTSNYASTGSSAAPSAPDSGVPGMRTGIHLAAYSEKPHVKIRIDNQTGGNANVSAATVATP